MFEARGKFDTGIELTVDTVCSGDSDVCYVVLLKSLCGFGIFVYAIYLIDCRVKDLLECQVNFGQFLIMGFFATY